MFGKVPHFDEEHAGEVRQREPERRKNVENTVQT